MGHDMKNRDLNLELKIMVGLLEEAAGYLAYLPPAERREQYEKLMSVHKLVRLEGAEDIVHDAVRRGLSNPITWVETWACDHDGRKGAEVFDCKCFEYFRGDNLALAPDPEPVWRLARHIEQAYARNAGQQLARR